MRVQPTGYRPDNPKLVLPGGMLEYYPPVIVDQGAQIIVRCKSHAAEWVIGYTLFVTAFIWIWLWAAARGGASAAMQWIIVVPAALAFAGTTGGGIWLWRKRARDARNGPRIIVDLQRRTFELPLTGTKMPLGTLVRFECVKVIHGWHTDEGTWRNVRWDLVAVFDTPNGPWHRNLWSTNSPPHRVANRLGAELTVPVHECRLDFREPAPTR